MTEKEIKQASTLLDTKAAFEESPEEFANVVDMPTWRVMIAAGREYVAKRLAELGVMP